MRRKAISLKQPYANLVCSGKKTIETRKWNTKYRGDIVICSSQLPKVEPFGKALCIVEVYHTEPMKKEHEKKACIKTYPKAWAWPPAPNMPSFCVFKTYYTGHIFLFSS